jgi:TonB family protein
MTRVRLVLALGRPDPDRLSTALLWSLVGHLFVAAGAIAYQGVSARIPERPAPYFVRLTSLPGAPRAGGGVGAAPERPAPPAPAEPKPRTPPPPPTKASLPAPVVRKAAPTPRPQPEPSPAATPAAAPGPVLPAGTTGGGSPGGAGPATAPGPGTAAGTGASFGEGDFQYEWYRNALESQLRSMWRRPVSTEAETRTATVTFTIHRDGSVEGVAVGTASGNAALDISAIRAVYDAAPLPPLPKTWKGDSVHVTMEFQLTPGAP